jgi:hypothetical protein
MGRVGVGMVLALAWPCAALGGCSDGPALPSVSSCSAGWKPLTGRGNDLSVPAALAYSEGNLYYPSEPQVTPIIQSMSVDDLSVQTLPVTWPGDPLLADDLWVEGDHLLVTGFEQFFSIPLAGGAAQLIYDGRAAGNTFPNSPYQTYTETDFFWTEFTEPLTTTVFRSSRSGGAPMMLGAVTNLVQGMALAQDSVVLAGEAGGWAVPLDGSPVRTLAAGSPYFAGVDGQGIYFTQVTSNPDQAYLSLSPADGGTAQLFWPAVPADAAPTQVWSDGQGGWVVTGVQVFDDHHPHLAVWLVDAGGNGHLAACDASADDSADAFFANLAPAVGPDAVYLVTEYLSGDDSWEIDQIDR